MTKKKKIYFIPHILSDTGFGLLKSGDVLFNRFPGSVYTMIYDLYHAFKTSKNINNNITFTSITHHMTIESEITRISNTNPIYHPHSKKKEYKSPRP